MGHFAISIPTRDHLEIRSFFLLFICNQECAFLMTGLFSSAYRVHPSPVSRVRGNRMNNQKFAW